MDRSCEYISTSNFKLTTGLGRANARTAVGDVHGLIGWREHVHARACSRSMNGRCYCPHHRCSYRQRWRAVHAECACFCPQGCWCCSSPGLPQGPRGSPRPTTCPCPTWAACTTSWAETTATWRLPTTLWSAWPSWAPPCPITKWGHAPRVQRVPVKPCHTCDGAFDVLDVCRASASSWSPSLTQRVLTLSSLLPKPVRPFLDARYGTVGPVFCHEAIPTWPHLVETFQWDVVVLFECTHQSGCPPYPLRNSQCAWGVFSVHSSIDPCVQWNPWHPPCSSERGFYHESYPSGRERPQLSGLTHGLPGGHRRPIGPHQQGG